MWLNNHRGWLMFILFFMFGLPTAMAAVPKLGWLKVAMWFVLWILLSAIWVGIRGWRDRRVVAEIRRNQARRLGAR